MENFNIDIEQLKYAGECIAGLFVIVAIAGILTRPKKKDEHKPFKMKQNGMGN